MNMKITGRKAMNAPPVPWRWRGLAAASPAAKMVPEGIEPESHVLDGS